MAAPLPEEVGVILKQLVQQQTQLLKGQDDMRAVFTLRMDAFEKQGTDFAEQLRLGGAP